MNKKNKTTSLGKLSVAFALIPLGGVLLFLLPIIFGKHSGEAGLAALLAIGAILYYGAHVVLVTSFLGVSLSILAICKTLWKQGMAGLLLNFSTLILSVAYLASLYHRAYTDPDRIVIASHQGKKETVEKLLDKGFDINQKLGGDTALSHAARQGNEDIVKLLLARGADINIGNPIAAAAQNGHEKIVKLLLEHGANPNCLYSAVSGRNIEIVKLLLEHGAEVNYSDNNKHTPLHRAVVSGTDDIIKLLINKGADVNAQDRQGNTPLHIISETWPQKWWAEDFREKATNILLTSGADIEAKNKKDKTPLCLAAEKGFRDAIISLLEHDANPENISDLNLRFTAAPISMNKTELEKWVLANVDNINAQNSSGETLLHSAIKGGNKPLVEILINLGADINTTTNKKDAPLHWAVRELQPQIVDLLISKGAHVNTKNSKGSTPLHLLAEPVTIGSEKSLGQDRIKIFKTLLINGAIVDIKDNDGRTPLELEQHWLPQSEKGRQYQAEVIQLMQKYQKR